jgi:hypothetical protein
MWKLKTSQVWILENILLYKASVSGVPYLGNFKFCKYKYVFFFKYFADRAFQYIYLLISTNLMH